MINYFNRGELSKKILAHKAVYAWASSIAVVAGSSPVSRKMIKEVGSQQ